MRIPRKPGTGITAAWNSFGREISECSVAEAGSSLNDGLTRNAEIFDRERRQVPA